MNEWTIIVVGILLLFVGIRLFLKPLKLLFRLGINSIAGLMTLVCFNFLQGITGVTIGINLFSALLTGFLGLPGAALLLLLGKFL
ncbi:MAG: pro-sigmaK processing inhibitor BofA [Ruminococcaceae bacterium]|nr:pro-sigmaK processing inhibitor BofA [Oscillospiraceae bacterium]